MKMERLGKHIKFARLFFALRHLSSSVDNSRDTKRKWLLCCDLHDRCNVHRQSMGHRSVALHFSKSTQDGK